MSLEMLMCSLQVENILLYFPKKHTYVICSDRIFSQPYNIYYIAYIYGNMRDWLLSKLTALEFT